MGNLSPQEADSLAREEIGRLFLVGVQQWARARQRERDADTARRQLLVPCLFPAVYERNRPVMLCLALTQFFEALRFWQYEERTRDLREQCFVRCDEHGIFHSYCVRFRWHRGAHTSNPARATELDAPLRAEIAERESQNGFLDYLARYAGAEKAKGVEVCHPAAPRCPPEEGLAGFSSEDERPT